MNSQENLMVENDLQACFERERQLVSLNLVVNVFFNNANNKNYIKANNIERKYIMFHCELHLYFEFQYES